MGIMVLRLDVPCYIGIIEEDQLLLIKTFDPENVNEVLSDVGDYPIDEIRVFIKPDFRSNLLGLKVDRIVSEHLDYDFFVSEGDHDFVKACARKFGANTIKYYSAFRYYQSLKENGVIIDNYEHHSYVVSHLSGGYFKSITVCSQTKLQSTVTACVDLDITYASSKIIPVLGNIEHIPPELHEVLAFLGFMLTGQPCCEMDMASGEIFIYGDSELYYKLSESERLELIASVEGKLTPWFKRKRRRFSSVDVVCVIIFLMSAMLLSTTIFAINNISSDFTILDAKKAENFAYMRRLNTEIKYLNSSIENFGNDGLIVKLIELDGILNNGSIMSVRYIMGGFELTLIVSSEDMKDRAIQDLEQKYDIIGTVFEKTVRDQASNSEFMQYLIVVKYRD